LFAVGLFSLRLYGLPGSTYGQMKTHVIAEIEQVGGGGRAAWVIDGQ
jgi:hypothetical protein